MKTLATLFLFCFAVFLNAQPAVTNDTLNQTDSLGKRQGYWKCTAEMKKRNDFPSPQSIIEEGSYLNGQKTGSWITYYPNGNVHIRMVYERNRGNGPATLYFENGKIQETGTWKGTRWIGEYKLYYENDTLRQHFFFDSMGRRHGIQYAWWSNGKLMYESPHVNGKQEGWTKEFYEDGNPKSKVFYVNGYVATDSVAKNYPPLPPRKIPDPRPRPPVPPAPPEKNFCDGYATLYNSNQQIAKRGTFKNCKLVEGEERLYDANGLLMQIRMYRDGKYVGDSPLPTEEPKTQSECDRVITEKQKKFVDSVLQTIPCYHQNDSLHKAILKAPGYDEGKNWKGDGWAILYKCNEKEMEGWFSKYRLLCGVQYIFDANGLLISVKFYEEGKFVKEIAVP